MGISGFVPVQKAMAATQSTYYVDVANGNDSNTVTSTGNAWKTITKARDYVSGSKGSMTGDILVYLRGGTYQLSNTLTFTEQDSGNNGYYVRYLAYNGEKPLISGGQSITGWTQVSGQNFYQADCTIDNFRQLYVNSERAQRARSAGTYTASSFYNDTTDINSDKDGLTVPTSVIGTNWKNKSDIELVRTEEWLNPMQQLKMLLPMVEIM